MRGPKPFLQNIYMYRPISRLVLAVHAVNSIGQQSEFSEMLLFGEKLSLQNQICIDFALYYNSFLEAF